MAQCFLPGAARHAVLARRGWDVNRDGVAGAPSLRIITSSEVHGTTTRAAKLLGIGAANIVFCRRPGRMPADAGRGPGGRRPDDRVLAGGRREHRAFDPFRHRRPGGGAGAWVHVDGAFGLWAAAPALAAPGQGVERADSWATDGHKWLNVPYDCGFAFWPTRRHRAAWSHALGVPSRRPRLEPRSARLGARAFAAGAWLHRSWAALRHLGRHGVAELVERSVARAAASAAGLAEPPGCRNVERRRAEPGALPLRGRRGDPTRSLAAVQSSGEA